MGTRGITSIDTAIDKQLANSKARLPLLKKLLTLFSTWELYPILLFAAGLHFYHPDIAIFKYDEPNMYRFSREAVTYGFIPLTSNPSTIGNMNTPLMAYIGMISAAFSSNPIWAQVLVSFCNFLAILLTYFFVRRYYGRLTGSIATLLYTTAVFPLVYSRFFWNPNFLPLFVILFMMAIFRGVVERRKGWFAPALLLVGIAYQLHATGLFLLIPLALAVLFAWRTVRVRDFLWAGGGLLLMFAPFIYWEVKAKFSDVYILLQAAKGRVVISTLPLHWYKLFLTPSVQSIFKLEALLPTDPHSLLVSSPLSHFTWLLQVDDNVMPLLLICAMLFVAGQIILPLRPSQHVTTPRFLDGLASWWTAFSANPYRQALVLLLSWQIIPLVLLFRQTIPLLAQYFIIFVPGQFILIALFLSGLVKLVQGYRPRWSVFVSYGVCGVASFLVLAQFLGSFSLLFDAAHGHFAPAPYGHYYSETGSLQKLATTADALAQEHHIGRIYISTSFEFSQAMYYDAEQMHTPTSVFENDTGCFVLPSPDAGPVIFITQSYGPFDDSFIAAYAHVTLIETSPRLSGPPFRLYILTTKPIQTLRSFTPGLQSLSSKANLVASVDDNQQWLTTRWSVTNTAKPALRTTYYYTFQYQATGGSWSGTPTCSASSLWAGDQLFAFTANSNGTPLPTSLAVQVTFSKEVPVEYQSWFNLWLVSQKTQVSEKKMLRTISGQNELTFSIASSGT